MSTDADPVAARIGYLRACMDAAIQQPEAFDLPVLLGDWGQALEALAAVLALHQPGRVMILGKLCRKHEDYRHFSISATEADEVGQCPACMATVYVSCTGCGVPRPLDDCPDRRAISAALTGTESTDA